MGFTVCARSEMLRVLFVAIAFQLLCASHAHGLLSTILSSQEVVPGVWQPSWSWNGIPNLSPAAFGFANTTGFWTSNNASRSLTFTPPTTSGWWLGREPWQFVAGVAQIQSLQNGDVVWQDFADPPNTAVFSLHSWLGPQFSGISATTTSLSFQGETSGPGAIAAFNCAEFPPILTFNCTDLDFSIIVGLSEDGQLLYTQQPFLYGPGPYNLTIFTNGSCTEPTWMFPFAVSPFSNFATFQDMFFMNIPGSCSQFYTLNATSQQWLMQTVCLNNEAGTQCANPQFMSATMLACLATTQGQGQASTFPLTIYSMNQGGSFAWGRVLQQPSFPPASFNLAISPSWQVLISGSMYAVASANGNIFLGAFGGCDFGHYLNDSGQCVPCDFGQYNQYLVGGCSGCPPGLTTFLLGSTAPSACVPCPQSYYCIDGAQIACPAGTYNIQTGRSSPGACFPCPGGTAGQDGTCKPCPAGTAAPPGSAVCTTCTAGTYANGLAQESCEQCPPGRYSTAIGATTPNVCQLCPAGTYSPNPGAVALNDCFPCAAGTFSSATGAPFSMVCAECVPGTYNALLGQSSATACVSCPPGSYASYQGSSTCTPCAAGYYSATGGSSPFVCSICPAGSYSSSGSSACSSCIAGTYSNATQATTSAVCLACPAGMYGPVSGATALAQCLLCPDGRYSAATGASICANQCPLGTYGIATGAMSITGCSNCHAGSYANSTGLSRCTKCAYNSYSNATGATTAVTCASCPASLGTMSPGATSAGDCQICAVGWFYSMSTGCTPCPPGTWSNTPNAMSSAVCTACPEGTASALQNATSLSQCQPCPASTRSAAGSSQCGFCDSGYTPGTDDNSCVFCTAGTYGQPAGQCSLCPAGFISTAGSTVLSDCTACPLGTYQLSGQPQCVPCDAGSYQDTAAASSCKQCPAGTYANATGATGVLACFPCPTGSFSTQVGASSLSACQLCPAGSYQNSTGISSIGGCVPCPPNSWGSSSGASQLNSCLPCSPLSSCYIGSRSSWISGAEAIAAGNVKDGVMYGSDVDDRLDYEQSITDAVSSGQHDLNIRILLLGVGVVILAGILAAVTLRSQMARKLFQRVDIAFARSHVVLPGRPIVARTTYLGGVMTSALVALMILVLSYLTTQFALYNQTVLSTVVAGQLSANSNITIAVQATGYGGNCDASNPSFKPQSSGILFTADPTYAVSFVAINNTCIITWTCTACVISAESSPVTFTYSEVGSYAARLQWQVTATPVIQQETNSVRGFAVSNNPTSVLAGSAATTAQIAVFETVFTDYNGAKSSGIRLFNSTIDPGSVQTGASLYMQSGLIVIIQLQRFVAYAQVSVLSTTTWVQFFTSIFSLCGAVFTTSAVFLYAIETVVLRVQARAQSGEVTAKASVLNVSLNPLYRVATAERDELSRPSYDPPMSGKPALSSIKASLLEDYDNL